jgi:hypothetical protein
MDNSSLEMLARTTREKDFRQKAKAVYEDLEGKGLKPRIYETLRTPQQQRQKVKLGYSKTMRSAHLPDKTGLARAADIADRAVGWSATRRFWLTLGRSATARGLEWGGFYGLSLKQRKALQRVLDDRDFTNDYIKLGWDPAHIQSK